MRFLQPHKSLSHPSGDLIWSALRICTWEAAAVHFICWALDACLWTMKRMYELRTTTMVISGSGE